QRGGGPTNTDVLVKLTAAGQLDPSFGTGGRLALGFSSQTGALAPSAVRVLADGRIVFSVPQEGGPAAVARLTPSGVPDPSFGGNVADQASVFPVLTRASAMPVAPGSVLAGGTADGTTRVLAPTGSGFALSAPVTFFPGLPLGVRTATADVNGDGTPDLIGGA